MLLMLIFVSIADAQVFYIGKYGGKPNSDIAQALTSAYKEACASTTPSKVVVPKGRYNLSPVNFEGPCRAPIEFQFQDTFIAATEKTTEDSWVAFSRIDRITVSGGGVFDGQGPTAWGKDPTKLVITYGGKWVENFYESDETEFLKVHRNLTYNELVKVVQGVANIDLTRFTIVLRTLVDNTPNGAHRRLIVTSPSNGALWPQEAYNVRLVIFTSFEARKNISRTFQGHKLQLSMFRKEENRSEGGLSGGRETRPEEGDDAKVRRFMKKKKRFQFSSEAAALHIRDLAPGESINTDGIHIGRSSGINVIDSNIKTGDDCVSIGDGSQQITIQRVTCVPGHGISVGSLGKYENEEPVVGVAVRYCTLTGTSNGVRIKTWPASYEGSVSDMHFEDIIINNVGTLVLIDQAYCPWNQCNAKVPSKVKISGVTFKNIRGNSSTPIAVKLACSSGFPCQGVEIADIDLR
ncbi:hypothetical protein EZV62_020742 [Acer yangbiense]|uniref:Pectate lyase superfamily protein domain-containing protein n=1 Tax=Acer yangbiense TaxID=1000413 RepID=A0A5C7HGY9_9ROSI|nr:hypothetical protein EZV62_020742 [Acer yangbiense]